MHQPDLLVSATSLQIFFFLPRQPNLNLCQLISLLFFSVWCLDWNCRSDLFGYRRFNSSLPRGDTWTYGYKFSKCELHKDYTRSHVGILGYIRASCLWTQLVFVKCLWTQIIALFQQKVYEDRFWCKNVFTPNSDTKAKMLICLWGWSGN